MPKRKSKKVKSKQKQIKVKTRRIKHRSYLKKMIVTDQTKPNGVKENPFIIKNRSISNRVNSIIVGIQQPIIQLLDLTKDTWYKQYCDPLTKTIFLEVYDKEHG